MDADGENLQAAGVTAPLKAEFGDPFFSPETENVKSRAFHAGIDRVNTSVDDLPVRARECFLNSACRAGSGHFVRYS